VLLEADPVPGAVHEEGPVAGLGDHPAGGPVHLLGRDPGGGGLDPGLLSGPDHQEDLEEARLRLAHEEGAGDVGAVPLEPPPEVHHHRVPVADHPVARLVVGEAPFGPDATMLKAAASWPSSTVRAATSAERRRSLLPAKRCSPRRSTTRSTAAPARRSSATSSGPLRILSSPVKGEAGPKAARGRRSCKSRRNTTRSGPPRPPAAGTRIGGHQRHRVVGLCPREHGERPRVQGNAGGLETGDHQGGGPLRRQHQHGEPLQGHGPVAGEIGQVGPDGEQQHVDTRGGHQAPRPLHAPGVVESGHRAAA